MDTVCTEEQEAIRHAVRTLLARHGGPGRATARAPAGCDTALWRGLARALALPGLALPETCGGAGRGPLGLAVAAEETGRALVDSPLVPTAALAAPLLLALGTEAQRARLLPRLATGDLTAALALPAGVGLPEALGLTGPLDPPDAACPHRVGEHWCGGGGRAGGIQARRTVDGWQLYGEAGQVLRGDSAGLLLVAAHTGGFTRSRTLLFLVAQDAAGLVRVRQPGPDETRAAARVELRDVAAELLGSSDEQDARPALAAVGPQVAAVLAAEAVGAADSALRWTADRVTAPWLHGRTGGPPPSVRHRLTEVYAQVGAARSAAYHAARSAAGERAQARTAGCLALAQGLEALRLAAAEAARPPAAPRDADTVRPGRAAPTQLTARRALPAHSGEEAARERAAEAYYRRAVGDDLLFGPVHRLRARAAECAALFGTPAREAVAV